jgi:hypothetical protein
MGISWSLGLVAGLIVAIYILGWSFYQRVIAPIHAKRLPPKSRPPPVLNSQLYRNCSYLG